MPILDGLFCVYISDLIMYYLELANITDTAAFFLPPRRDGEKSDDSTSINLLYLV